MLCMKSRRNMHLLVLISTVCGGRRSNNIFLRMEISSSMEEKVDEAAEDPEVRGASACSFLSRDVEPRRAMPSR